MADERFFILSERDLTDFAKQTQAVTLTTLVTFYGFSLEADGAEALGQGLSDFLQQQRGWMDEREIGKGCHRSVCRRGVERKHKQGGRGGMMDQTSEHTEGQAGKANGKDLPAQIAEILSDFHRQLGEALNQAPTPQQIVELFQAVEQRSRELLERVGDETGYGGGLIAGLIKAQDIEAILVSQAGWLTINRSTARVIRMNRHEAGWLSFAIAGESEAARLLVPLPDISGMRIAAEALGEGNGAEVPA